MPYLSPGPSHIVPVLVGDAALAKAASDRLLSEHNIYVQSINYPTVARGEERLRITVTPRHTFEQMDRLIRAVDQIFTELGINRLQDWKAAGGRAGVGMPDGQDYVEPIWTDEQLGLVNGTTPPTLRNGEQPLVNKKAVTVARTRFNHLLGPVTGKLQPTRSLDGSVPPAAFVMKTGGMPLAEEMPMPAASPSIAASA